MRKEILKKLQVACLFFSFPSLSLFAKEFKNQGEEFPIIEESFGAAFQRKLQAIGEAKLQERQEELQKRLISQAQNPRLVEGLEESKSYASYFFDPSITAKEDIKDERGRLIVKKGTKINPLDFITLDTALLFFDGTNPKHLHWAKKEQEPAKWILIKGSPINLEEQEEREVFFDQQGIYTQKFQIRKVPCRLSQQGKLLLIEEMPAEEEDS